MVGSSSIRISPAFTSEPSRTWIARTTPVSNGWITLVRPLATILPGAVATMSIFPKAVQASATQKSAIIVSATARPTGEGGVSTTSRAAGRNASSSRSRRVLDFGKATTAALLDFMEAALDAMEVCIPSAGADQFIMGAVLDQTSSIDSDDPVGSAHGREAVGDNENGTPPGDL